jgi:GNAT superfamily N-acetyltransferase
MPLDNGYVDLPTGKLANVVVCLEMVAPPERRPDPPHPELSLERLNDTQIERYRALFRRVGERYLWFSRLALSGGELASILRDDRVEAYALRHNGEDAGILELDFRTDGECEIAFFGIVESLVGNGIGRWLMNRAIERAFARPIRRFHLHTCSLDHPNALPFYLRSGFVPYKRQIEICDDPRLNGLLSRGAAPEVPVI